MSSFSRRGRRLAAPIGLALALVLAAPLTAAPPGRPSYPDAPRGDVTDDYHGVKVADPYRELEDPDDPATRRWVEAENVLTRSYLDAVPGRDELRRRLTELNDYAKYNAPERRGDLYFYSYNTGLQNQSVYYVQKGLAGEPRALIDPNTLTEDGTAALVMTAPSEDGRLVAYAISRSGSDRREIFVRDVATGKDLSDHLLWAKFTNAEWTPDGKGFYYTRFPKPGDVAAGDENYFGKIYYHEIGEAQEKDALVFERPERKEIFLAADVSRDGRYAVFTGFIGAGGKSEVWVLDRTRAGARPERLFEGFDHSWLFLGSHEGRFFFRTDRDAPRGRIVALDYARGEREPRELLPQGPDRLGEGRLVGDKLVVSWLHNASSALTVHGLDGKREGEIALPALGEVMGQTGRSGDPDLFFIYQSFVQPATVYRYEIKARKLAEFRKPTLRIQPGDFETRQVWYPSKDGTKVSMFIVHRKGLVLDGRRPTFLTAYGGFDVDMTPGFVPGQVAWMERGGVIAMPNLRGGGEYGEEWHKAGMLERKQNVFDDFIAAAEWLTKNGYTRPDRLAIEGGSNGGLLVSACMIQRPDLFGAVLCRVPVADMLRYHRFTVGRFWIPEYGSSEDPKEFEFLRRYSPYHNVADGVRYPATLITTADHDDRVLPGHANKLAARLQAATGGESPILIRIEVRAGHGAGKPTSKRIDEWTDLLSFLFWRLEMNGAGRAG
jgi:prolyl oligopeptidase